MQPESQSVERDRIRRVLDVLSIADTLRRQWGFSKTRYQNVMAVPMIQRYSTGGYMRGPPNFGNKCTEEAAI